MRKFLLWDIGLAILALLITILYVYNWKLHFHSDYALIGLIAKRILDTGEQFLFVPSVGYQGLIIEGNLIAFLFKLFGVSPYALHLAPAIIALLLYFVFYKCIQIWHDTNTARIALLLCLISAPIWYDKVHRTQPNYGEIFTLGFLLFIIYKKIIDAPFNFFYWAITGFIIGFGLYIYGQINYFIISILLSTIWSSYVSLIYKKNKVSWRLLLNPTIFFKRTTFSYINQLIFYSGVFLLILNIIYSFEPGILSLISPWVEINFEQILSLKNSILLICLPHISNLLLYYLPQLNKKLLILIFQCFIGFGLMFALGYSPKIYYNYILELPSNSHTSMVVSFTELAHNTKIFVEGISIFFNTLVLPPSGYFIIFITIISVYIYIIHSHPTPITFLILTTPILFVLSKNITNLYSIRYALILLPCWGLTIAYTFLYGRKTFKYNKTYTWLLYAVFIFILSHRSWALLINIKNSPTKYGGAEVVDILEKENINRAYASYWHAYIINFCTNEKIIIEPLASNYLPFYAETVDSAKRIGYILHPAHYPIPSNLQKHTICGVMYETEKIYRIKELYIFILNKAKDQDCDSL